MPRFFNAEINDKEAYIRGEDAVHIGKSLRMNIGDEVIICDSGGFDYRTVIESIAKDEVTLRILEKSQSCSEPSLKITLYQALPKGEKFEDILKKAVELGVFSIVPVITSRVISRPDEKSRHTKQKRWQKIVLEAAKQSGRGIVPNVQNIKMFHEILKEFLSHETSVIFYENSKNNLKDILKHASADIGIMIGSEGGFSQQEVDILTGGGAFCSSLGKRILRCETAPLTAISVIMYETGELTP